MTYAKNAVEKICACCNMAGRLSGGGVQRDHFNSNVTVQTLQGIPTLSIDLVNNTPAPLPKGRIAYDINTDVVFYADGIRWRPIGSACDTTIFFDEIDECIPGGGVTFLGDVRICQPGKSLFVRNIQECSPGSGIMVTGVLNTTDINNSGTITTNNLVAITATITTLVVTDATVDNLTVNTQATFCGALVAFDSFSECVLGGGINVTSANTTFSGTVTANAGDFVTLNADTLIADVFLQVCGAAVAQIDNLAECTLGHNIVVSSDIVTSEDVIINGDLIAANYNFININEAGGSGESILGSQPGPGNNVRSFKTIAAGAGGGVTVTSDVNDVFITNTMTGANLGPAAGPDVGQVFASRTSDTLNFRALVPGAQDNSLAMSLAQTATTIQLIPETARRSLLAFDDGTQTIPNDTWTQVNLQSFNGNGEFEYFEFSNAHNGIIKRAPGRVLLTAKLGWETDNNGDRAIAILTTPNAPPALPVNDTNVNIIATSAAAINTASSGGLVGGGEDPMTGPAIVLDDTSTYAVNDLATLWVYQSSGGPLDIDNSQLCAVWFGGSN